MSPRRQTLPVVFPLLAIPLALVRSHDVPRRYQIFFRFSRKRDIQSILHSMILSLSEKDVISKSEISSGKETFVQKKRSLSSDSLSKTTSPRIVKESPSKKRKVGVKPKCAGNIRTGRWNKEEHALFLEGIRLHGKEWKKIASMIDTRSVVQIRTHAQKYFQKLNKRKNQEQLKGSMEVPSLTSESSISIASSGRKSSSSKKRKVESRKNLLTPSTPKKSKKSPKVKKKQGKKADVPFKIASNLSLQLPVFDVAKENNREKSPISVVDLDSNMDPNESFTSFSAIGETSFVNGLDGPSLCNWLNDVRVEHNDDSSDSTSSTFSNHSDLDESNTVYVDTRCALEGSVLSTLDSYHYETEDLFSVATTRIAGGW